MRTISAAMEKVLAGPHATHVRVRVKDSGGTWRDLSALEGRNWIVSADWGGNVDQTVQDANVSLIRDIARLSMSPLMSASKLNLLTGLYSALIDISREIKIETATVPSYATPIAADWSLAFHGVIDSVQFDGDEMQLQCSDLGRRLERAQIKSELVYPCCPNYHRAPIWTANTAYENIWPADARTGAIRPTVANGYAYCLYDDDGGSTGATEPTWPTTTGATVVDGGLRWMCMGALPTRYGAAMWEASKSVSVGDICAIDTGSGYIGAYRCTSAGTTSPDAPRIEGWRSYGGSPSGWEIIPTAANATLYRVTIGGINCDYTSDSSATVAEICAGLAAAINALTGTHGLTATDGASKVTLAGAWKLVRCSSLVATTYAPDGTAVWKQLQIPEYSPFAGKVLLEDLLDMILRDWASVTTLSVPVSTAWVVGQYMQQRSSVLSALDTLAGMIGWTFRYKYDATSGSFLPTIYCVDRAKATIDRTLSSDAYDSIDSLIRSIEDLRNSVDVVYSDASASPINGIDYPRKTVSASDSTSIAAYGEQWCEIAESSASLIDTAAEATTLANAVLSDLKDPLAEQSASMRMLPFVEYDDRIKFSANSVHYDTDQTFAVTGYRHTAQEGVCKTTLQCRQRPSGGFRRWHKRIARPGGERHASLTPTPVPTVAVTNKVGACVLSVTSWWPTTESAELYIATTAGLTPSAASFEMRSRSSKLYVPLAAGTYFGRVIVRDSKGNASAPSAEFVLKPT